MKPIQKDLRAHANPEKAALLQGFFKTGKGEYGEGDQFLGLMVPQTRKIAHAHGDLTLNEIDLLLDSPYHEERLAALLVLVHQFERGDTETQATIHDFYLKHAARVNNWDLVDLTAPRIVGMHLRTRKRTELDRLARSKNLWERRIAIVSTLALIQQNEFEDTKRITTVLLHDSHDLIHKACGWMLREVGKKDEKTLENYLKNHYRRMPRTMLRYAIEKFPENKRNAYLHGMI